MPADPQLQACIRLWGAYQLACERATWLSALIEPGDEAAAERSLAALFMRLSDRGPFTVDEAADDMVATDDKAAARWRRWQGAHFHEVLLEHLAFGNESGVVDLLDVIDDGVVIHVHLWEEPT